jgi:urease accessory protein
LRQSGSIRLVFPQTHTADVETVVVNTSGGITGGDCFDLDLIAEEGASLTITTQAAERAYRAQPGEVGTFTTRLAARDGAYLRWLPQELILFERCNLQRRLTVDLDPNARLLLVEPMVFGRAAMGETLRDVRFSDRIKITRNGRPIYVDGIDLEGDAAANLGRAATAAGALAMCSVVMITPDAVQRLGTLRSMLPRTAGASLLAEDILVIRVLASESYTLRRDLIPVLEHLNQSPLPASWRL